MSLSYIETSQLICSANQLTGFFVQGTLTVKGLTGVLSSRDSEIRGAILRIAKTNTILKSPVNKLFPIENTYQDTNQTVKARSSRNW